MEREKKYEMLNKLQREISTCEGIMDRESTSQNRLYQLTYIKQGLVQANKIVCEYLEED